MTQIEDKLLALPYEANAPLAARLRQGLQLGVDILGLEFGIVSHVDGETYTVVSQISPEGSLVDGQAFPYASTYCNITLREDDVVAIDDMGKSKYCAHPCYALFKLNAYIGVPIRLDGQVFGTINFSSPLSYGRSFTDDDR